MRVSFIIPAYNASKTIIRCLNSIYSLGLPDQDYEVIVIDDASSDDTVDIVKNQIVAHENLVLLRQPENHRQGAARNRGITVAKGNSIVFVDSDDETAPGVIPAINSCVDRGLDLVAMRVDTLNNDGQVIKETTKPLGEKPVFSGQELQTNHPFWFTGPVAYVYRKEFLEKVGYPFAENVLFEDSDFVNVHLFYANRMSYSDECGYLIHYNETSTTRTISVNHVCDYAVLGNRMLSFYENVIDEKGSVYANSILEGGSYNIMRSCRNLFKLESRSEVQAFYARFDRFCDRKRLSRYREPSYCWNRWTRFCMKHKKWTIWIVGAVLSSHLLDLKTIVKRH